MFSGFKIWWATISRCNGKGCCLCSLSISGCKDQDYYDAVEHKRLLSLGFSEDEIAKGLYGPQFDDENGKSINFLDIEVI